jgi:hypothetical protein
MIDNFHVDRLFLRKNDTLLYGHDRGKAIYQLCLNYIFKLLLQCSINEKIFIRRKVYVVGMNLLGLNLIKLKYSNSTV